MSRPTLIGCFGQASTVLTGPATRIDNFARLKSRGINTLLTEEASEPRAGWVAAAKRNGLKYYLKPVFKAGGSFGLLAGDLDPDQLRADDADPDCLGWAFPDEYDRTAGTVENAQRISAQIRAVSRKPISWNFTGQSPGLGDPKNKARIQALMACCDVVSWDFYMYATGRTPFAVNGDATKGYGANWLALMDRVQDWGGGKPQLVVIDCSRQFADPRDPPGPTAAQYEEMVKAVVEYAAAKGINLLGIELFPQRLKGENGFEFDATPPDVAAAMLAVHAKYFAPLPAPPDAQGPVATPASAELSDDAVAVIARIDALAARVDALTLALAQPRTIPGVVPAPAK